ncbi:MAG: HAD-IA family hydrolase [Bdellovibrionales bacterium]|nr:HAD-IA family hydrolase [Bdellovibrionales bacterium]
MINLLIFDLDGTLFHTAPGIVNAFNKLMADHGEPAVDSETIISYIGDGIKELLVKLDSRLMHPTNNIAQLEAQFHNYYSNCYLKESFLYPGVLDFLKSWPHELAIVSNKSEHYVRELVSKSELNQFNWRKILGGNSLPVKKPNPQVIHEVLSETNTELKNCLMIGDGLPDMLVARNADIRSVAVSFGYGPISQLIQCGAHATIAHYKELPKVIRAFS